MSDQSTMTPQQARIVLWTMMATLAVSLLGFVALVIYGLAHPVKHRVLLVLLATVICPLVFAIILRKAGIGGLFEQGSAIPPTSIKAALRRDPTVLILSPMMITGIFWYFLLVAIGTRKGGDHREWLKNHIVLGVLLVMMPQVLAAYLSVVLHATYTGMYIAGCIVYATVKVAVGGLKLENGAVAFFGTYKSHASPLVILTLALICVASFGVLHFAVWSTWSSEYLNMHGIEDAMYFSVVDNGDCRVRGHTAGRACRAGALCRRNFVRDPVASCGRLSIHDYLVASQSTGIGEQSEHFEGHPRCGSERRPKTARARRRIPLRGRFVVRKICGQRIVVSLTTNL